MKILLLVVGIIIFVQMIEAMTRMSNERLERYYLWLPVVESRRQPIRLSNILFLLVVVIGLLLVIEEMFAPAAGF